jgi:hypothetical protein
MKKLFVSAVISLSLVTVITGIVLASFPHKEASGSFSTTSTAIHRVTQDKFNEVIDLESTVAYTGTLEGISTIQGTLTIHRDGNASFLGVETFSGQVNGTPGTITFKLKGNCAALEAMQFTSSITSSAGELAGLRGELLKTWTVKDNVRVGTYTGHINNQ